MLTKKSKYGLKAVLVLAEEAGRGPVLVSELADRQRLPKKFLEAILLELKRHGLLQSKKGRGGGYFLSRKPADITVGQVIRVLDGPLALQDYGDQPIVSGRERAVCLVGANLVFRRRVFDVVGVFTPSLGRVKDGIGSTEDHDMQLRAWKAGMRGLYDPRLRVEADVTPDRLTRSYHRRWHRGHGRHCAMMRLRELVPADLGPLTEPGDVILLFGSPAFVYADLLRTGYNWMRAVVLRRDPNFYSHQFHHEWNYIRTSVKLFSREGARSSPAELVHFTRAYLRKRRARRLKHCGA